MAATRIISVDPQQFQDEPLQEAARVLARGGLVVIPTETVYGIAASAGNKEAMQRLHQVKQRPKDKPFPFLVDTIEKAEEMGQDIPVAAYNLVDKFWPGPLTLVVKSKTAGTVGLRMPDCAVALRIIELAHVPLVCPSANISGQPAPEDCAQALRDLSGQVDLAIDAGPAKLKQESSVLDLSVQPPRLLREGFIKQADIEVVLKSKTVLFVCTGNSCRSVMAQAILEKILKEKNRPDVRVLSAGIMMMAGLGASQETRELLRREGMDVSAHRSQRVTLDMIKRVDLILVMEKLQEEKILEMAPFAKNRLFLLKEFAKIEGNYLDIPDPIGRSFEFYEQTFGIIREAVERVAKII